MDIDGSFVLSSNGLATSGYGKLRIAYGQCLTHAFLSSICLATSGHCKACIAHGLCLTHTFPHSWRLPTSGYLHQRQHVSSLRDVSSTRRRGLRSELVCGSCVGAENLRNRSLVSPESKWPVELWRYDLSGYGDMACRGMGMWPVELWMVPA